MPTGTATFGASALTSLTFSNPATTVGGWIFDAGASNYTFTTNAESLHFNGAGIDIQGGSVVIDNNYGLYFSNNSTAGSVTIVNNGGVYFFDGSNAGSAAITNDLSLQFFSDSTAGSATITNNGALHFYDNSTAGHAAITTSAGGSVDFSNTTGPHGDGRISAGSIAGAGSYILGANELTVGSNNLSTEVSGAISGAGALVKVGTGMLTLSGANTYSGGTTIAGGILAVNGQIGGTLEVLAAGRLQGTGTVGDTAVSGTIAPGNSIGTIKVGNVTFNAGSIYEVEVNAAGQSDRINASGTATINGGSVRVLAGAGDYAGATTYTILTAAGGRTGAFSGGATSNLAFLDPFLSYDAGNVYLTMARNDIDFAAVGLTPNQIAAGGGVESLGFGQPVYHAVLNLSAPQARTAFDQLSGEIHASAQTALIEDSRFIRDAVNDRLRAALGVAGAPGTVTVYSDGRPVLARADTDRLAVWGRGFGAWGHTNGDGNAARFNRSTGGVFVGADAWIADRWRLGAATGYSRTAFNASDRSSSGASDNYHASLYAGTAWGDLAFRGGAAYTWHGISTGRSVLFPGFGDSLRGDYNAATAQIFGELAHGFNAGAARFEPFASLAYVNLHTDGLTERGGAAALTGAPAGTDAIFTTLGLRTSAAFALGGTTLTARGTLGWRHAFGDVTTLLVMRFAGGGNAFAIGGVPIARDAAAIEAGLDYAIAPNATLSATYGGQFGAAASDQSVKATFSVAF